MRHIALSIMLLTAALTGCQSSGTSSIPAVDPFAAYGHTRIAPPATNSYGKANQNPYYNGAAQADASDTGEMLAANTGQASQAFSLVDATKEPTHQANTASYEAATNDQLSTAVASNESPIRIVERVGSVTASETDFKGMAVVDASGSSPRLASQASSALSHGSVGQPAQFQAAQDATPIHTLPSSEAAERPLPVRGFSSPRTDEPTTIPAPTPTPLRPSATIQAGRFIPLEIATRRNRLPERETIAAAAGN